MRELHTTTDMKGSVLLLGFAKAAWSKEACWIKNRLKEALGNIIRIHNEMPNQLWDVLANGCPY
jgi:hypothetical protein